MSHPGIESLAVNILLMCLIIEQTTHDMRCIDGIILTAIADYVNNSKVLLFIRILGIIVV